MIEAVRRALGDVVEIEDSVDTVSRYLYLQIRRGIRWYGGHGDERGDNYVIQTWFISRENGRQVCCRVCSGICRRARGQRSVTSMAGATFLGSLLLGKVFPFTIGAASCNGIGSD